ncbi:LysR family transcriptional regulator [Litoreibacter meonggei]|uniref:LysR family transcriptional regulator n=1 Tax=Litoreibacter meonggei TaxID=1049199 RepID=A0A497X6H8_9RHOB|nr:LysR family transcriptional regulator [Litoreibacter meonggei]RLJ60711.1 LysR family transcriptional regulator [Litoreibacter meonggei]
MFRPLPPLNALRAFESAGRHQSFSGAATELGVSHSAISRHVRGLEHRLGTQLFRDLPRGVTLTQAGARYLAQVTPALDAISEATEVFHDRPVGRLVVNSEPLFASRFVVPRLADFYDRYPEVELRMEASQQLADMSRYEADLAIRSYASGVPEHASDLISDAKLFVYGAPSLIGDGLGPPEDVLKFRRFQDRRGNPWAEWAQLAGVSTAEFVAPDWRMRSPLAFEAALAGQGLFLCAEDVMANVCAKGDMVKCWPIGFRSGSYHLVAGDGVRRSAPVRAFRNWLLDQALQFRSTEGSGNS